MGYDGGSAERSSVSSSFRDVVGRIRDSWRARLDHVALRNMTSYIRSMSSTWRSSLHVDRRSRGSDASSSGSLVAGRDLDSGLRSRVLHSPPPSKRWITVSAASVGVSGAGSKRRQRERGPRRGIARASIRNHPARAGGHAVLTLIPLGSQQPN